MSLGFRSSSLVIFVTRLANLWETFPHVHLARIFIQAQSRLWVFFFFTVVPSKTLPAFVVTDAPGL